MKLNTAILAGALSLGFVGLSDAQTTVYMTGSTAFRSSVYAAIIAPGVLFTAAPTQTLYEGGTTGNNAGGGANYMGFTGTATAANGGGALTLKCHWSGSEAGVHDVASGLSETFIADSAMNGADNGTNEPSATVSAVVDLAMADAAQSFSQFSVKRGFPNVVTNKFVGVICFTFVRNKGLFTGTNISSSQFRQAENVTSLSPCPLAVFSGNAADTSTFVYVSGRDNGSGTRVNCFGETGYGIFNPANQIELDSTGNMIEVGGTGSGIYLGDYGFSSGGTLAGTLGTDTTTKDDKVAGTTGLGFSVVAYLGRSDANKAIGLGAVELSFDGATESRQTIIEGTFNYWGNEYILQRNGAGVIGQDLYKSLANGGIDAQIGTGANAIRISDMHCSRNGPTSDPVHN